MLGTYVREQLIFKVHQYFMYGLGLLLFSLGVKAFIDAKLGTDPLAVLEIGMNNFHHLGIGFSSMVISIGFLGWWTVWNWKVPPVTPFVSTVAVGYLIDLWNTLHLESFEHQFLPVVPVTLIGHVLDLAAVGLDVVALMTCAYASALIIMSGIGIRIMDLVALTMMEKWNWSFFQGKMTLEVGLFLSGWALGGPMGFTTIAFLFLVGPFIQPFMWANAKYLNFPNHGIKSDPALA
jgi:uncharacterized membrane protein YczE